MLNKSILVIIPGERIGIYHVNWHVDFLIRNLSSAYKVVDTPLEWCINHKNYGFDIRKFDHKVNKIYVFEPFKEKILGKIGCGAYLKDFQNADISVAFPITPLKEHYILPDYPGVLFYLKEEDESEYWDENEEEDADENWNDCLLPLYSVCVYDTKFDWHYFTNEEQNAIGYHYQDEPYPFDKSKIIKKYKEPASFRSIRDKIVAQFGSIENLIKKRLQEKKRYSDSPLIDVRQITH